MGEVDGPLRVPLLHRPSFYICIAVAVALLDGYGSRNGVRWGSWVTLIFFLAYAVYCIQNWFACREIHCAITGPGFLLAALLQAARIAGVLGGGVRPLWIAVLAQPWVVFVAAALIGMALETSYASRYGTIFMRPKK